MRTDKNGNVCPGTLGEYRDLCEALGVPDNQAVDFLDGKIAESPNGEDEKVLAPDSQMRYVLYPMLFRIAKREE